MPIPSPDDEIMFLAGMGMSARQPSPRSIMRVGGHLLKWVPPVPDEHFLANVRSCLARQLPCIQMRPPRARPWCAVAIVAGGPSVVNDLETIRKGNGYVVAINGTHDWLQDNGITPDALILCDPTPLLAEHCRHPNDTTTYLISSCCDPSVFDALEGKRVVMWHPIHVPMIQAIMYEAKITEIGFERAEMGFGAASCATLAPSITYAIGFREFHLFGVDSSCVGNKTHAVRNFGSRLGEQRSPDCVAQVGDESFTTRMTWAAQAQYLWRLVEMAPADTKIFVHGSGLGPAVVAAKGKFEILSQGATPAKRNKTWLDLAEAELPPLN
jgi:hypothetical protein